MSNSNADSFVPRGVNTEAASQMKKAKPYNRRIALRLTDKQSQQVFEFVYEDRYMNFDLEKARKELRDKLDILLEKILGSES